MITKPLMVDISPKVLAQIRKIIEEYAPGREVLLFGSRVTGLARPDSDLDLLIAGEPPLTRRQLSELSWAFEESKLPFAIDMLDLHEAQGNFRKRVESEWVPLNKACEQMLRAAE